MTTYKLTVLLVLALVLDGVSFALFTYLHPDIGFSDTPFVMGLYESFGILGPLLAKLILATIVVCLVFVFKSRISKFTKVLMGVAAILTFVGVVFNVYALVVMA